VGKDLTHNVTYTFFVSSKILWMEEFGESFLTVIE